MPQVCTVLPVPTINIALYGMIVVYHNFFFFSSKTHSIPNHTMNPTQSGKIQSTHKHPSHDDARRLNPKDVSFVRSSRLTMDEGLRAEARSE